MSEVNAASRWNPADYAANAAFVPAMGAAVLALLDPQPGERILDLGCGDGVLTERIAAAGATVVGVDASAEMIAAADKAGVAAGVFRALRPGGRFVGEMGGEGNVRAIWDALYAEFAARGIALPDRHPHWYAAPADFTATYAAAGFVAIEARLIPRPTPLPTGITGWIRTFRAGLFDAVHVPEAAQADIAAAVEHRLAPVLRQPDGTWLADYVRLRFTMRKPA